jgi:uncharacterized protein (DUF305 family)
MIKRLAFVTTLILLLAAGIASAQEPLTRSERAEIRFLEGMIDHHQMALDMAAHCLEQTGSEGIHEFCQAVIDAQGPEIELMQGWLLEWYNIDYAPMPMAAMAEDDAHAGHEGMDHGASEDGPFTDPSMMMGMMAGLDRVSGVEYSLTWLEAMIDHHDDALHMSERILPRVVHPELGELAEQIIADQSAEIDMMEAMIIELGGEA